MERLQRFTIAIGRGKLRVTESPVTQGEQESLLSFANENKITQRNWWGGTLPAAREDNGIAKSQLLTQASCLLSKALGCSQLSYQNKGGGALFIGFQGDYISQFQLGRPILT